MIFNKKFYKSKRFYLAILFAFISFRTFMNALYFTSACGLFGSLILFYRSFFLDNNEKRKND